MKALALHRPAMATVLDWEEPSQLSEVLSWAEEAAMHVTESVLLIPKVPGHVSDLPRSIGGKRVVIGYSVPTGYGASPLFLSELAGWPVHLLGGMPHRQLEIYGYLRGISEVVSVDGNSAHQQAHKCRFWSRKAGKKGHWIQLSEAGDTRAEGANLECFRRSLEEISGAWGNRP
jgi:hypothetical protein